MILKGNQRANGRELAMHLLNVEDNEHAVVHDLRGFLSDELIGAFKETEAISLGTKCQQYLFSLSLNPPPLAMVSVEEFERVIGEIERRLGLSDQPRAVVFHEKNGRRHAHCIWSRIDVEKMRAINLPHFKYRLQDISRELYLEMGWEMPAGLRDAADRDPLSFSGAEASQAKRVKRDAADLKELFQSCWAASDSRAAFATALQEKGFCLARGDRRGFVAVDAHGEVYSLSRWVGVKAKELRSRLGEFDDLPSVEEALSRLNGVSPRADIDQTFRRSIEGHEAKLAELVARQRQERTDLSRALDTRRIAETKARSSRLPKGMKAAWARLTGQYPQLLQELVNEAAACAQRDRDEQQALIDRHIAERRILGRELEHLRAQDALTREFLERSCPVLPLKYQADPRQKLILPPEDVPFNKEQLKRQPSLILTHLSDKNAQFSRNDVLRGLAEFISDPVQLRIAGDNALAAPELVRVPNDFEEIFTTQDYLRAEQTLMHQAQELSRCGGFTVNNANIDESIRHANSDLRNRVGAELSDEQVTAIRHVLAPNQLCAVVGLAGAGKSTLLATAREAWERQGYRVHGAALAGKAADSLQNASGIRSRTLASIEASWKSGYEPVSAGDIVVIDEAGMVGTRQLSRVTKRLQERGCKIVLVGDPDQLQPIQAGAPFRDIADKVGAARLTEIRRQKSAWQKQASQDLASGNVERALHAYADRGAVRDAPDRERSIAALVDDYMADLESSGSTKSRLALAHRRKDVHAINQAILSAKQASDLTRNETLFTTEHGPRAFADGDRILFTRNDATLGVRNGKLGTIKKVGDGQLTVRIDSDDLKNGRVLSFSPKEYPSIDHGFAVSIHRAQGCTVDRSFVLSSRTLDKNLTYVALTRHNDETCLYVAPDIAPNREMVFPLDFAPRGNRARMPSRTR